MTVFDIFKGIVGLVVGIIGCVIALVGCVLFLPIWVLCWCGTTLIGLADKMFDSIDYGQSEKHSEASPT